MSEAVTVDVRLADAEPFSSLATGTAEAAGMFAKLTEAERDALPDAALSGIARLNGAIAEFTGERALPREAGPPYRGVVVIEWPAPYGASPYSTMNGWNVKVTDAVTGKPITTCTGITVRADPQAIVAADLTLFTDADGEPLLDGEPVPDGDGFRTGVFPFAVAEMRVRDRQ